MPKLSAITSEQRARFRRNIARAQVSARPLIVFEDGLFKLLSDGVPLNYTTYVACIEEVDAVWSMFHGGVVEEVTRTNWFEDELPPKPKCPVPKSEWEENEKTGKPKNPLGMAYEVPLITNDLEARLLVFRASTRLGQAAVTALMAEVDAHDAEVLRRPFITLMPKQSGEKLIPTLQVDGFSDDMSDIAALSGDKSANGANGKERAPSKTGAPVD